MISNKKARRNYRRAFLLQYVLQQAKILTIFVTHISRTIPVAGRKVSKVFFIRQ